MIKKIFKSSNEILKETLKPEICLLLLIININNIK